MPALTAEPNLVLTNARLVLGSEIVLGTLTIRDGRIAAIDTGTCSVAGALDLDGDWLIPGLVEIHTDNLERHLMPRPKTHFPPQPALLAHDAEVASAGITTVFDALGVGDPYGDSFRSQNHADLIDLLDRLEARGLLRARHLLHVRCELPAANTRDLFSAYADCARLRMLSLMDHTPGQRQWTDIEHARTYFTGKKGWTNEQFDHEVMHAPERQRLYVAPNRHYFAAFARERGVALATHDDTTEAHVQEAVDDGATISEFPTTALAARCARTHGLATVAGAPNVVRGGSHSGNVAAIDLARDGLLDVLSSDYVPASLLTAAWRLHHDAELPLPAAVATVSGNAARAAGLTDRGEIAVGLLADLVRVREFDRQPVVGDVWVNGRRVH
ncbi:MAG: alpha-D-ribose 1-methylphosphonate 5-triphosphate diphosphatase [Burkholderiaceae bacterium]